jgi:hypothetical protein
MTWRTYLDPVLAFRVVIIGGFLAMLAANMPGHLSFDSVTQLYDGRHQVRDTWAPAVYSALLGGFDQIVPGTSLYLAASGLISFGALLALRSLRPTLSWLAPLVALGVVLSPNLLIYQGIVWKDVLFANLGVAGFVLLAHIAKVWEKPGRPVVALLALAIILALAAQVRQNGLVITGVAAVVMAWTVREGGWRSVLGWSLGGMVAVVLMSQAMATLSLPSGAPADDGLHRGMRILQHYDIIGASAHDKTLVLEDIAAENPAAARVIRERGVPVYSPERVDYLSQDPAVGAVLWRLPDELVSRQWLNLMIHHPGAYLAQRLDAFRWVLFTPMIDSCLPLYVGVSGPSEKLKDLQIPGVIDATDQKVRNYGTWFLDTPVLSHVSYVLIGLLTMLLLLLRRDPQDIAMVGLMVAALLFASSFFVISIACDYRYLYFVDLAAMAGLIYLAIDPPFRGKSGAGKP